MQKIHINKRQAVSPLIATILLVAVALSLAGILYSWSSQNAKETTANVTETTKGWINCGAVNIFVDYGCTYDIEDGISFVLNDQSTVAIDDNITMTVVDANKQVVSKSFAPNFQGRVMAVNNTVYDTPEDLQDLEEPLEKVMVYVNSCPDKATYATCN